MSAWTRSPKAEISELMSRRWSAPSWQRALVRCLRRGF
jgi:hypothetical protein